MKSAVTLFMALVCLFLSNAAHAEQGFDYSLACESNGRSRAVCMLPSHGANGFPVVAVRVDLVRQMSRTNCVEKLNWGYNGKSVWVEGGCRASFYVSMVQIQTPPLHKVYNIGCESRGGRIASCPVGDYIQMVYLERQISRAACNEGKDWGWTGSNIWVQNGCRADFRVETF